MSKYQINYNRVAPDHRVPFDYQFLKKNQSPLDYYKVSSIANLSTGNKASTHRGQSSTTCTLPQPGLCFWAAPSCTHCGTAVQIKS